MPSPTTKGDVALTAQPATEDAFAPFGRLLLPGDRTYVGKRGRVLLAIDEKRAGPRRVADLYCYPEAKRVLVPLGAVAMWFVALEPGEQPGGEAQAFLLPPGCGVVINEGVWHAGPMPLADASLCELLETTGATDRFDRRSLRELIDVAAVRVLLPEDPADATPRFDVAGKDVVRIDSALVGRVRIACVSLSGLRIEAVSPALEAEWTRVADGLRSMWGHGANLAEIPGVQAARAVLRDAGMDPERTPPPAETLLAGVLAGGGSEAGTTLAAALELCALRLQLPLAAYDVGTIEPPVTVHAGASGAAYPAEDGRRLAAEGLPVLSDEAGILGGPLGVSSRAAAGAATQTALITVFCPRSAEAKALQEWLDSLVRTITEHCGGAEAGRLILE